MNSQERQILREEAKLKAEALREEAKLRAEEKAYERELNLQTNLEIAKLRNEERKAERLKRKEANRNSVGLVIVWMVFFFPYGFYRLWNGDYQKKNKILWTILMIIFIIVSQIMARIQVVPV